MPPSLVPAPQAALPSPNGVAKRKGPHRLFAASDAGLRKEKSGGVLLSRLQVRKYHCRCGS